MYNIQIQQNIENRENGQRLLKLSSRALAFCHLGMSYLVITHNRAKEAFTEEEQNTGLFDDENENQLSLFGQRNK